ncbi:hypothetical protein Tco_0309902 [Tanacetum coccineum]
MLGSLLSDSPLLIVPQVWSVAVGCDEFGKEGSRVLAPDLVVIAKVGASDSRVLFFPIVEAKDIYEVIDKEYSPITIPARRDIDNPDELCRTEEFTVIRHSISNDEEFVTINPSKISIVEELLAACLASTTNSLAEKIADER